MAKTITNQQIIGNRGEVFVSERANAMGFMFSRYGPLEAGMDGLLEIRDPVSGTASGRLIAVQVKTKNAGPYSAETEDGFEYLMDEGDVAYWKGCNLPVIVVLVHLEKNEAYWKSVDSGGAPAARRLRIDKRKDVFAALARDSIAELCVAKAGFGVWFPPLKTEESGHLNLLEVVLPARIHIAASTHKTGRAALNELLELDERPPDDWLIKAGQFMSFRDPRDSILRHVIDSGSVEDFASSELAFPDDEADEYTIIELLRRTLGVQLEGTLVYSRDQKAYHFPADREKIERAYVYKSLSNWTSAGVVSKYEKNGVLKYVRHHAFEPRFWRVGDTWFLSITPTFVFTWDGFRPDRFASGRLAGKKKLERNPALLGQFAMWKFLLTGAADDPATLFAASTATEDLLRFRPVETLGLPRGVPDDIWRASEAETLIDVDQGSFAL